MDLKDINTKLNRSEREKQILYANTYIWNLEKKYGSDEPREGPDRNKDADEENGLEDMGRGKGKLGCESVALTYIHY